ncbi:tetratricopeptide repeat protein [Roseofilum casamattae]|uniref:Tetratricopeptide repeat protein n=1 Tax=Roseofilum casamattae BLCC-M143 TaxID=3022442 RepID=A0ABT7BZ28_9CYAN|nr:tetratricopeptide repeat protein [Roseofilum casamattae]MDJ1184435.1 tetratricopeptide repeat protein [Roseofilum casamattae BLCC-M143]
MRQRQLLWISVIGVTLSFPSLLMPEKTWYGNLAARAAEQCTAIAQIEQVNGAGFQYNGEEKQPLTTGSILCAEHTVESDLASDIRLRCLADNELHSLLTGIELDINNLCAVVLRCDNAKERNCGRGGNDPHKNLDIITPRETALLNRQPKLAWNRVAGASHYTVIIEHDIEGKIWETETETTELTYLGNPPLESGPIYTLKITADTGEKAMTTFHLLDEEKVSEITPYLQPSGNPERIGQQLALYKQYSLQAEAIAFLNDFIDPNTESSYLHRELGDLYWRVGQTEPAEKAYLNAVDLAVQEQNLAAEALARARLGELYQLFKDPEQAREQLERAHQLYQQTEQLDNSTQLERLLN